MDAQSELETILAVHAELNAVTSQVKELPGYGDFLASPQFDDVARAATCPVVYVVAASRGGFALLVHDAVVERIPLGELTDDQLQVRVAAYLAAYAEYQKDRKASRASWYAALDDLTSWLWDAVMGPVLAALPGATPEAALVAGGLLGLLPLHAAWTSDARRPTGRRFALDAATISYVPNARSLEVARSIAAHVVPRRLLAVAEPLPVSAGRLPGAQAESMAASAAFPDDPVVLTGGKATPLAFGRSVGQADVLHLACHGFADLARSLDSGVLLAGNRRVTLRDLMVRRLRIRLAVLSACETGLLGTELPDEVLSLPAGLLQAGVAGVVASQWSVPDLPTAMLMTEFYRCWRWERMTPAGALRAAQQWLRDSTNEEKASRYLEAAAASAEWLPTEVAEDFLDHLDSGSPDDRDHADIHAWGAFAHFGA
jgi:CHAT domain-containing protein